MSKWLKAMKLQNSYLKSVYGDYQNEFVTNFVI
jgi:hypothetical protein